METRKKKEKEFSSREKKNPGRWLYSVAQSTQKIRVSYKEQVEASSVEDAMKMSIELEYKVRTLNHLFIFKSI